MDADRSRAIAAGAILAIVVIVFAFSQLSRRVGEDTHAGSMAALGGIALCLVVVWARQRRLGLGWQEIGLRRPRSWPRTLGLGILVAVTSNAALYPNSASKRQIASGSSVSGNYDLSITAQLSNFPRFCPARRAPPPPRPRRVAPHWPVRLGDL